MTKPPRKQQPEEIADEAMSTARSILERVTGERMPNRTLSARAASGGTARAAKLTPERRSAIAAKAAKGRWKK